MFITPLLYKYDLKIDTQNTHDLISQYIQVEKEDFTFAFTVNNIKYNVKNNKALTKVYFEDFEQDNYMNFKPSKYVPGRYYLPGVYS